MDAFLKILFSLSFSGAFLFLFVFLIVQMYRNRLSRRWQYYIWLLVVLRFLIPLTFPHSVTGYLFRGAEQAVAERRAAAAAERADRTEDVPEDAADRTEDVPGGAADRAEDVPGGAADRTEDVPEGAADRTGDALDKNAEQDAAFGTEGDSDALTVSFSEEGRDRRLPDFAFCLFGIWAAGALVLLIRKITIYQSYMRFLRKGNTEVSDLESLNLLAEAEEGLRIRRTVELYRNPLVTSPIMTGFFRPQIVIPDKKMTDAELSCIFTHELVHFKYFDMFYKWLVQVTICIHWFNPFVYLLGKEVNKCCELSCDERVISALNEQERKNYGDTLLSFLKRGETYQNPLASITLTEGAEQLIERLGAIMDYQKKSKSIMILTAVLTVLLCFFFSGIGAYAGASAGRQETVQKETQDMDDHLFYDGQKETKSMDDHLFYDEQKETQDIDYSLLYDEENHTYYILLEGADLSDIPVGGATGGIAIVLVRKSGYTSFLFSSFSVKSGFLDEVESQCQDAVEKGAVSETEAELIWDVAEAIVEGMAAETDVQESVGQKADELKNKSYSYVQQTFYEEPYLISFGWNLRKEDAQIYAHTEILVNDQSRMTVCFCEEAENWMKDTAALEAVGSLIEALQPEARGNYGMELEMPYVSQIIYLPSDEAEDFAERAFENGELADFAAVMSLLPEEVKTAYCERCYAEDKIDFFSVLISEMNAGYIAEFMERCYENGDIDYFAVASDDLPEKKRREFMERALREGRDDFYYMLKNMMDDWG